MKIIQTNWLKKDPAYTQAECALCIWEYAVESHRRSNQNTQPTFYDWLAKPFDEGAAEARSNAIGIAYLVEAAYQIGNDGDNILLSRWSFDWEVVPVICDELMELCSGPSHVNLGAARLIGKRLVKLMQENHS
jgi:hypothetical protein